MNSATPPSDDAYARLAELPLRIDDVRLESLGLDAGGWLRRSTVVRLIGGGVEGVGEDVGYDAADQVAFQKGGPGFDPRGTHTVGSFCLGLDDFALFPEPREGAVERRFRRWAFESAALDLALRQAGVSLAEALGLEVRPLTFVLSGGLGEPPSLSPVTRRLERYPGMRFKLDFSTGWTADIVAALRDTGAVDVVDFKGLYRDAFQDRPPTPRCIGRWRKDCPRSGSRIRS